ncbi:MAG: hypothetical protein JSR87_06600 [Proteobacteria bacterium]|nr:hypothetical protein [Pseudomonadota bacterium]
MPFHVHLSPARIRALAVSTAILATAFAAPGVMHAQEFMSEEELLQTLPGHEAHSVDKKGNAWAQVYSARSGSKKSGVFNGVWKTDKYTGKWTVKNGQWCEDTGDWQGCFQFVRIDAKTILAYRDGQKQKQWTLK